MSKTGLIKTILPGFTAVGLLALGFSFWSMNTEARRNRTQNVEAYEQEMDRLLSENRQSCQTADDCTTVAIGSRSCGGPSRFLITEKDTLARVQSEIKDLVAAITEVEDIENRDKVGTCIKLEPPPVACKEKRCKEGAAKNE